MRGSRKFRRGGGVGDNHWSTYFTEGRTDLAREAVGPIESNCFSRRVRTCDYTGVGYMGLGLGPPPTLDPPMKRKTFFLRKYHIFFQQMDRPMRQWYFTHKRKITF